MAAATLSPLEAAQSASPITWIHLSDWHQKVNPDGSIDPKVSPVLAALKKDIEERRELQLGGHAFEFAIFNGDIAYGGQTDEFEAAYSSLFKCVIDNLRDQDPGRVVVAAGNHDLQHDAICDPHLCGLTLPAKCFPGEWYEPAVWNAWLNDETLRDYLRRPFHNFREFAVKHLSIADADWVYNRRWKLGPAFCPIDVHVTCFNSALFCRRRPKPDLVVRQEIKEEGVKQFKVRFNDYGDLFVGDVQFDAGLRSVPQTGFYDDPKTLRIAVLHHPIAWLLHPERVGMRNRLIEHFDFVLTGHEHEQRVIEESSTQGQCVFIPAGAAYDSRFLGDGTSANEDSSYALAYNIVQLDANTGEGVIYLRRYDRRNKRFVAGYESRFPRGEYRFNLPEPEIPERDPAHETPFVDVSWNE